MKKQITAVEWLKNELWKKFNFSFSDNIFKQAKEMEKQQIIEAFDCDGEPEPGEEYISNGVMYFNETYK